MKHIEISIEYPREGMFFLTQEIGFVTSENYAPCDRPCKHDLTCCVDCQALNDRSSPKIFKRLGGITVFVL